MDDYSSYQYQSDPPEENSLVPIPEPPNPDPIPEPPRKKKGKGLKNFGKGFLALLLVAAVSVGSIAGYNWFTGGNGGDPGTTTQPTIEQEQNGGVKTIYNFEEGEGALSATEVFYKASPSVVAITCIIQDNTYYNPFGGGSATKTATGTGIIMTADGYIITNHHVVNGATNITVSTSDGTEYTATIVGMDEKTDIAVLKIDGTNLPAADFGDSSSVLIGEVAYVIGNPLGDELADTFTHGMISSTERQVKFTDSQGYDFYMNLIQTDAAVSPGNSGGPLINNRGQIIGVINSKISREGVEGIGFAIPVNTALSIANDLIANGEVTIRPVLGITISSFASDEAAARHNAQYSDMIQSGQMPKAQKGIIVMSVTPNSAAFDAGLKMGDKIIAFNGVTVADSLELNYEKEKCKVGDSATITVERDGETLDLTVVFQPGVST